VLEERVVPLGVLLVWLNVDFLHLRLADLHAGSMQRGPLPALQQLMGHSQIRATMLYIQLAPQDVWRECARAFEKRIHQRPSLP